MAMLPNPLPKLAADPTGGTLGLRLPPGALIDTTDDGPWHEPLLWCSDGAAEPGTWSEMLAARRTAGLHPVLIGGSERHGGPGEWELSPDLMTYPGDHDAEDVLADFWEASTGYEDDQDPAGEAAAERGTGRWDEAEKTLAPFGADWPGLAPARTYEEDPDARAAEVAGLLTAEGHWLAGSSIALVPARRSADIPAALGWTGPLNHENDVARLCAVLRSWEDRFGIRVVALTFDQLVLSVAAPPATQEEAEAVAAEHFAFCPDNITQGRHGSLRDYAEKELLDQPVWSFWWD